MARGGLIRNLMTREQASANIAADAVVEPAHDAPTDVQQELEIEPAVGDVRSDSASAQSPPSPRARVSLLGSLGPIFRAALVYPGVSAPAGAWAGAVRRMSEVSAQLTDQLARMQSDEIDIPWARRELHPPIVQIVAEFWIAGVLRSRALAGVEDVPLRPEEILSGLIAAERAAHGYARIREPLGLPIEADLLPALAMVSVNAQAYANMLRTHAGVELSVDSYVAVVADATLTAIAQGADRMQVAGADRQSFMQALLGASTGLVAKACELAINEALQQLADTLKDRGKLPAEERGFPVERTTQLLSAAISRLAGTYAYVAQRMEDGNG